MSTPLARGAAAAEHGPSDPVELEPCSPGHFEVRGPLTFATARRARELGLNLLDVGGGANALEIDCSQITVSDSAGLCVLLDWLTIAKRSHRTLRLSGLPDQLMALAKIANVDKMLERGVESA